MGLRISCTFCFIPERPESDWRVGERISRACSLSSGEGQLLCCKSLATRGERVISIWFKEEKNAFPLAKELELPAMTALIARRL